MDGNTHYGWIRLSTSIDLDAPHNRNGNPARLYCATAPNSPIHAGDQDGYAIPIPTGKGAETATSAKAKWGIVGGVGYFELRYKMTTAADWTTIIVPAAKTAKRLTGLNCSTVYAWQVRAFCAHGVITDFCSSQTFTTAACRLDGSDPVAEADAEIHTYGNQNFIDIYDGQTPATTFDIYNLQGQLIESHAIEQESSVITINVPDGIYIGNLQIHDKMITKKIVLAD